MTVIFLLAIQLVLTLSGLHLLQGIDLPESTQLINAAWAESSADGDNDTENKAESLFMNLPVTATFQEVYDADWYQFTPSATKRLSIVIVSPGTSAIEQSVVTLREGSTVLETVYGSGTIARQFTGGTKYTLEATQKEGAIVSGKNYTLTVKEQRIAGSIAGYRANLNVNLKLKAVNVSGVTAGTVIDVVYNPTTGAYDQDVWAGTWEVSTACPYFIGSKTNITVDGQTSGAQYLYNAPIYAGDVNSDGTINGTDLLQVYNYLHRAVDPTDPRNVDGSGTTVDLKDLSIVAMNMGRAAP